MERREIVVEKQKRNKRPGRGGSCLPLLQIRVTATHAGGGTLK
jgi:hypothetical protein